MIRLLTFYFLFALSPLSFAQPVILVFGDSLSAGYGLNQGEGWVQLLQSRLNEKKYPHQVINASISGNTTDNGRDRIVKTLAKHKPDVVIIELGG
ncbi:MAG: GDSL-type esterase/lipase family protein, partial [Gammaproteobacteria bacterium]|nr:GDSL-type esterase/lipase family protein [Gammaproteobacteria bacterium]